MADYNRLIKEWTVVKAFWNRDDNVSLSKHCDEGGVDYKRCITHNQPMRKQESTEARNKYADEQIEKFQDKLVPRNQQGATTTRRESVTSTTSVKSAAGDVEKLKEEVETLKTTNDRLRAEKNDLADIVAELKAMLKRATAKPTTATTAAAPAKSWVCPQGGCDHCADAKAAGRPADRLLCSAYDPEEMYFE